MAVKKQVHHLFYSLSLKRDRKKLFIWSTGQFNDHSQKKQGA